VETESTYEIFKKESDNSTVLVESVKGLEEAQKRITELNGAEPDLYFVFDPLKAAVVDPYNPGVVADPLTP